MTPNIALQTAAANPAISFAYLNPLDLTAPCLAWFDTRLGVNYVSASSKVSELFDLSGNGNNLSQASSGSQPALVTSNLAGVSGVKPNGGSPSTNLVGATGSATNFSNTTPFTVWMIVEGGINAGSAFVNPGHMFNDLVFVSGIFGWSLAMNSFYNGTHDTYVPCFIMDSTGGYIQVEAHGTDMSNASANFLVRVTYDGSGVAAGVKIYINEVLQTPTVVSDTLSASILVAAYNMLTIGNTLSSQQGGVSVLLAAGAFAGVIAAASADAVMLHTYAQQQFGCV